MRDIRNGRPGQSLVEFAMVAPLLFFLLLALGGVAVFTVRSIAFGTLVSSDVQDGSKNANHRYRVGFSLMTSAGACQLQAGETLQQALQGCGHRSSGRPISWTELALLESRDNNFTGFSLSFQSGMMTMRISPY